MKYPVKYARDCGPSATMGDLCEKIADALDAGPDGKFADVMDEEFIYGSWGWLLQEPPDDKQPHEVENIRHSPFENILLNKDIRGLAKVMYQIGRKRANARAAKIVREAFDPHSQAPLRESQFEEAAEKILKEE